MSNVKSIIWGGHTSDGTVDIYIDGRCYTYRLDAALIHRLERRFKHAPFKTLRVIEDECLWWVDPKGELHERETEC